jgi:hypothetical protein
MAPQQVFLRVLAAQVSSGKNRELLRAREFHQLNQSGEMNQHQPQVSLRAPLQILEDELLKGRELAIES